MAVWPNGKSYPGDVWHKFGPRAPIWTPSGYTSSFHEGIDIGPWDGANSTWLLSPVTGVVIHAQYDSVFGNRIVVRGEGADFWLCHGRPNSMQVSAGQSVTQGQRLQLMGETGKASGVHVHYEVRVNGSPVDPQAFYAGTASGGNNTGDDMSVEDIYNARDGEGRNMLDLGRQIRADLNAIRNELVQAAALNATRDYPAFAAMEQRGAKYDVRPGGVGADWKLGPTIFEYLAGAQNRAVTEDQVKQIADAVVAAVGKPKVEIDYAKIAKTINDDVAARLAE